MQGTIQKQGELLVMSIPEKSIPQLDLQEGEEIAVDVISGEDGVFIRLAGVPAAGVDAAFARQVSEFIENNKSVLKALAR